MTITDADGNECALAMGKADNYGTVRTSCLFVVGDKVVVSFEPIGDRADIYLNANHQGYLAMDVQTLIEIFFPEHYRFTLGTYTP